MTLDAFPGAMPLQGLIGGLMIGLSAAIFLLGSGRIVGVSGIVARTFLLAKSGTPLSAAILFVLGLPLGAFLLQLLHGPIESNFVQSTTLLIVGGLLVGIGARIGSGCTSGHGVCGTSRLSPRSLIATATFITTGIATVTAMNMAGWQW